MEKIYSYIDTKIYQRYNFLSGKVRTRLVLHPDNLDDYWKNFSLRWNDFLGFHFRMILAINLLLLLRYRGIDYSQFLYPLLILFISLSAGTITSLYFGKKYRKQKPEEKFKKHEIGIILLSSLITLVIGLSLYFL